MTQLFQPFNRLGKEGSAEEGTGIGLVVSKRLVELMDGEIGVASSVGTGSAFWVELRSTAPLAIPVALESAVPAGSAITAPGARRTLLYVEDNPANLTLIERLISRRSDLHLLTAADGPRGLELARTSRPDVILMDINLPGISGIETLKILRDDQATANIPVLALSANAMAGDIQKGMEAGFLRYLTKPIKVSELMEALDAALDPSESDPADAT